MGYGQGFPQGSQGCSKEILMKTDIENVILDLDNEEISRVLDYIDGIYLSKCLNNNTLYPKDIELIQRLASEIEYEIQHKDFVSLVLIMKDSVREGSRGAVILDRIYVSSGLYKEIARNSEVSEKTAITVCGVKVCPSVIANGRSVIGIGRPKYNGVPAKQMLIKGLVR